MKIFRIWQQEKLQGICSFPFVLGFVNFLISHRVYETTSIVSASSTKY